MYKDLNEKINAYIELREELSILVKNIWDFLYKSYSASLDFGKDSTYYDFYVSKNWLTIRYHNNCDFEPDESDFDIPVERIINGNWRDYIIHVFHKDTEKESKNKLKILYKAINSFKNGK